MIESDYWLINSVISMIFKIIGLCWETRLGCLKSFFQWKIFIIAMMKEDAVISRCSVVVSLLCTHQNLFNVQRMQLVFIHTF